MSETRKPKREMVDLSGGNGLPVRGGIRPKERAPAAPVVPEGPESVIADAEAQRTAVDTHHVLTKAKERAYNALSPDEQDRREWEAEQKKERETDKVNEETAADDAVKRKLSKKL